jgi:hypothetical protein
VAERSLGKHALVGFGIKPLTGKAGDKTAAGEPGDPGFTQQLGTGLQNRIQGQVT